jgi:ribosomal protein S18 acetylase RimI-like enzyme
VEIRDHRSGDLASLHRLLCANGWAHRIPSPQWLGQLLAASQRTAVAEDADGMLVGFARGITDGLSNGYLSMVVIAPTHRRRGIGSALVRHVMGEASEVTWVLRAGRDAAPEFFAKLGFHPSATAMERRRG